MKYPIQIERNEITKHYCLKVVDLPGCQVDASSVDEGLTKLTEQMAAHLSILAEYGENIPAAKTVDEHIENNQTTNIIWAVIDFDIIPYMGKSHKINVTLPELLIKKIDDRVTKSADYSSRSGFIASACLAELAKK